MTDLVHNERTKLTAAWLNTIGSGIMITGVVGPFLAAYLNLGGTSTFTFPSLVVATIVCFGTSVALHLTARALLGRLR